MNPLEQITRTNALEFMNQVRKTTDPPGSTFISALDDHILNALPPPLTSEGSTLNRGDVIEIQGPAGSGKTQLLYFLSMTSLLPYEITIICNKNSGTDAPQRTRRTVLLGGRGGKGVVVMDCDGRWSAIRMHQILTSYVTAKVNMAFKDFRQTTGEVAGDNNAEARNDNSTGSVTFDPTVTSIVRDCLARMHIFRPTSSAVLAVTLSSLPVYHRTKMANQEIGMVMIDSLSTFHHPDKHRMEIDPQARTNAAVPSGPGTSSATGSRPIASADPNTMAHIINTLHTLRKRYGFVTFFTNWALISQHDGKAISSTHTLDKRDDWYGQHLLRPFPRLPQVQRDSKPGYSASHSVRPTSTISTPATIQPTLSEPLPLTHHITLPNHPIPSFDLGTTLDSAMADRQRNSLAENYKVLALVRTPVLDSQTGRISIVQGAFGYAIRDNSIGVE